MIDFEQKFSKLFLKSDSYFLLLIIYTHIFNGLSYDVASGSEKTPCIKIDKALVVYRFSGNVM